MPTLASLVGNMSLVRSAVLDEQHPVIVKIIGLESSGIWIESQNLMESWLKGLGRDSSPKTLVWFVPFSQIAWIMGSEDYPAFSRAYLGQTP